MRRIMLGVIILALVISGCDGNSSPPAAGSSPPPSSPGASSGPSSSRPGTASGAPQTIRLSRTADNTTVSARVGDELDVGLDSTYWTFTTRASAVLQPIGAPASVSDPSCVPGAGCGTITARYRLVGAGRALVSADRALCGEALHCNGIQHFQVTVVVSP